MILWHGHPANKVRRDEAKPHLITMHLRKGTGAMSIWPQPAPAARLVRV